MAKWTRGRCQTCRRFRDLNWSRCVTCRQPEDRRKLVALGVPCGSADSLIRIVHRCREKKKTVKETHAFLEMFHPILMENVLLTESWILCPKEPGMIWVRRGRWEPGKFDSP